MTKTKTGISFGERLRALRLSLEHGHLEELPCAAMDRAAFNQASRHRWRKLEALTESSPIDLSLAAAGMHGLVSRLDVTDPKKVEAHLVDYVYGRKDALPWTKAPGWKDGLSPIRHAGRPTGTRPVPQIVEGMVQFPAPLPTIPLQATLAGGDAPALVILKQIQSGGLTPEVALPLVKLLLGYSAPAQDLTHSGKERHFSQKAMQVPYSSAYVNRLLPVPRDLMADVIAAIAKAPPDVMQVVKDAMGSRAHPNSQKARKRA